MQYYVFTTGGQCYAISPSFVEPLLCLSKDHQNVTGYGTQGKHLKATVMVLLSK